MQYKISDIASMLRTYTRKAVAEKLGLSSVALNEMTRNVPQLRDMAQPVKNVPFTLTANGTDLMVSDAEEAISLDVLTLRDMLINTDKQKVAETLGTTVLTLNKVLKAFPEHFENLPKAIKMPFTLVDDEGNPVIILKRGAEVGEVEVEVEQPQAPSIVENVTEFMNDGLDESTESEPESEFEAPEFPETTTL